MRPLTEDNLVCGLETEGIVKWTSIATGEVLLAGTLRITQPHGNCHLLELMLLSSKAEGPPLKQQIWLHSTFQHRGGVWWFSCPHQTKDGHCGQNTATLYSPLPGWPFRCRECYDLTYQSCRDSNKDFTTQAERIAKKRGIPAMVAEQDLVLLRAVERAEWWRSFTLEWVQGDRRGLVAYTPPPPPGVEPLMKVITSYPPRASARPSKAPPGP